MVYYSKRRYRNKIRPWEPPGLIQNKIAKNILLGIAIAAGSVIVLTSPFGPYYVLKGLIKGGLEYWFHESDYEREIKRLQKKQFVSLTKTPDGWIAKLTKKGKMHLGRYKMQDLKLPEKKVKWDGKWRLLIFDIPEKQRSGRDLMRNKLKELGMFNIQRSVLAYPFDCREELGFLVDYYGLARYTTYAEVNSIDIDKELRKHFRIR